MKDQAYEEGRRAAAEAIPADANPYGAETQEHVRWEEGHASIAQALEATQAENI